jgi:hypothetical protein
MDHEGRSLNDVLLIRFKFRKLLDLLMVILSITVLEEGSSTGSSIRVAIKGSKNSSGASS